MLRARNAEQENVTHAHQVAGAAKSNALAPKTPGQQPLGKTPARRIALNDENKTVQNGKGKGKDLFQTPAPQNRAVLGAKTTNAKAKAFATPVAPLTGLKPTEDAKTPAQQRATSARKNKLKIHHSPRSQMQDRGLLDAGPDVETSDQNEVASDDEPPEIETANRLPEPDMEDHDSDIEIDHTFPMFKPENFFRGASHCFQLVGKDGLTDAQRREKEWDEQVEAEFLGEERRMTQRALRGWSHAELDQIRTDMQHAPPQSKSQKQAPATAKSRSTAFDRKPPSDAVSKSAASALSTGPRSTHQRSASTATSRFAAPTAASRAKEATVAKSTTHDSSSIQHSRTRSAVPMASNTTIGRAKGRQVSAELRAGKPKMADRRKPVIDAPQQQDEDEADTSLDFLSKWRRDFDEEELKKAGINVSLDDEGREALEAALDEEWLQKYDGFQLDMPEEEEAVPA